MFDKRALVCRTHAASPRPWMNGWTTSERLWTRSLLSGPRTAWAWCQPSPVERPVRLHVGCSAGFGGGPYKDCVDRQPARAGDGESDYGRDVHEIAPSRSWSAGRIPTSLGPQAEAAALSHALQKSWSATIPAPFLTSDQKSSEVRISGGGAAAANIRLGRRRSDQLGQDIEGLRYQPVIGPLASLLTGQDSGFDQNLEVMGHGWLR